MLLQLLIWILLRRIEDKLDSRQLASQLITLRMEPPPSSKWVAMTMFGWIVWHEDSFAESIFRDCQLLQDRRGQWNKLLICHLGWSPKKPPTSPKIFHKIKGKHCFLGTCGGLFWWTNPSGNLSLGAKKWLNSCLNPWGKMRMMYNLSRIFVKVRCKIGT
jgi:hypothetical protein